MPRLIANMTFDGDLLSIAGDLKFFALSVSIETELLI